MELLVVRYHKKPNYTIGKLFINGMYFCDTLEDPDRGLADCMPLSQIQKQKRYGDTAIPTGRYLVELHHVAKVRACAANSHRRKRL